MIDLHCHILPGFDDGARTLQEAIEMARIAEKDGISKIVATPHFLRNGIPPMDWAAYEIKCAELNQTLQEQKIGVEILTGAEVHVSHGLLEMIRGRRKFLTLNGSSYMFVEFPSEHVFSSAKDLFFSLMSEGITPIVAHPERNWVFAERPDILYELILMGGLAQTNSGSFTGRYGTRAHKAAMKFLELNLIHFIASDGHNRETAPPLLSEAVRRVSAVAGREKALDLVESNPRAVIDDEVIPFLKPPVNPKSREKSIKIRLPSIFKRRQ